MRQQGGFFYLVKIIIILAIVGAGFFYIQMQRILHPNIVRAADDHLIINEVQIYPAGNRFIELYNPKNSPVDLTGWSVKKKTSGGKEDSLLASSRFKGRLILSNGYLLLTNEEGYTGNVVPDVTWAKSYAFAKDNTIILYDNNQGVIDKVGFGLSTDCEGSCALNPAEGYSIQRNNFIDTNNNNVDFLPLANPNPHNSVTQTSSQTSPAVCGNGQIESGEQCDDGNLVSGDSCSSTCQIETTTSTPTAPTENSLATSTVETSNSLSASQKINLGDVVINELVSDPADNEVEWIELYNKAGREIDLTGWWLEEGSKAKTNLSGILGASGNERYKVIDKPSGNLNNSGDIIILYDANGKIIDQIAYGNWDDGNTTDNAPAANDPGGTARKFDGYNTFNNLNDFAETSKPTKGSSNIIEAEDEVSAEVKAKFDFSSDIYISEILPNPVGDDTKLEFIEIYNAGQREVNLTGWSLSNKDDKKVNLEKIATSTIIKAGEYLAFFRTRTKIVLHNDKGQVKLFQPLADKPLAVVDYKNVKEGWSYNLKTPLTPLLKGGSINGEWVWSETPTPGAANVIKAVNHAPEAEFNLPAQVLIGAPVIFDSSDTFDQDDDKLIFSWDFGDGFNNSLANPEHTYFNAGIYKVKLAVSDGKATSTKEKSIKAVNSLDKMANILDSRLRGNDKIEEAPRNDKIIINEIFPNPAGADTGQEWLELINQSEIEINLLNWRVENSNGKYGFKSERVLESGAFYVLDNAISKLAFKNTSDVINLYNDLDELADQVEYASAIQGEAYARGINGNWFWTTKITPGEENIISLAQSEASLEYQASGIKAAAGEYVETDLEKVREMEIGSLVKVKGTVAVEPGILGVQIFYIVGSPGIQIYNYKKDFPALRIGDYIEVTGELAQTQGELRIKTKDKNDINLIEYKAPPAALAIKAEEVNEENIGQLITVTGEITDKKSTSLYVDDGSDEVFVYIKQSAGIDTKSLAAGQKVSITGILSKTQTGLRLLPRGQEDIVLINSASELEPQVLGEVAVSREWDLAERDKKLELFKYLLIIAGGVIVLLLGLFIKAKRKN